MMMKLRIRVWLATLAVALVACAETVPEQSVGGETNWLVPCTHEGDCSQGRCLCGVCTVDCETSSACASEFAGECISVQSDVGASLCDGETSPIVGLCLPMCSADAECGETFACQDGVCVIRKPSIEADAGESYDAGLDAPSSLDAGACRQETPPSCTELQEFCTWTQAQTLLTPCTGRFGSYSAVRCGAYDGLIAPGTDSATYYYYDSTGSLVGVNDVGLGGTGCVSYDPAFTSPPTACETLTPECMSDTCDCSSAELALECVCAHATCRSFAAATSSEFCQAASPGLPTMQRGCGFTIVEADAGLGSIAFVYEGFEYTLVGASSISDLPYGACQTAWYATAIPDLTQCADYSICDLCASGAYPPCEE
jgi:hypothetical protein